MSDFFAFQPTEGVSEEMLLFALTSTEECAFQIETKIGDLINLAAFLKLAVNKQICTDQATVKAVTKLYESIFDSLRENFPVFYEMEDFNPEDYFKALGEAAEADLSEIKPALQSLTNYFQQMVDLIDSPDAADE